jgi:hypothetical protein
VSTSIVSERVTMLSGGCVVRLSALRLLWRLQARGLTVEREGDLLAVGPRELLSRKDRAQIKAHRDELLQLVDDTDRWRCEM